MIQVYIASPYTKGDVANNVRIQLETADELMDLGFCPIVPLFTHFQHMYKPRDYEDWMKIDEEKVKRSDVILRLPGDSPGADREVKLAQSLNIPVYYTIRDLVDSDLCKNYTESKVKSNYLGYNDIKTIFDKFIDKIDAKKLLKEKSLLIEYNYDNIIVYSSDDDRIEIFDVGDYDVSSTEKSNRNAKIYIRLY